MTNNQIMKKHLAARVIQPLLAGGFTGKYPHFRREKTGCIELITFQTDKHGGSFTVEVSAIFPDKKNKNFVLDEGLSMDDITVWSTDERYRLKGMYNGWFYYRDVYTKHIPGLGKEYIDVSETAPNAGVPNGYKLVQTFDEQTVEKICNEVNRQLVKAFNWLRKFEKKMETA